MLDLLGKKTTDYAAARVGEGRSWIGAYTLKSFISQRRGFFEMLDMKSFLKMQSKNRTVCGLGKFMSR